MDGAVDDEHGSGLGSEFHVRPVGEKSFRLHDAHFGLADVENPVRLFVEVRYLAWGASEARRIRRGQFPSILDIEADRPEIVLVHAAVHSKPQRLALALKVR